MCSRECNDQLKTISVDGKSLTWKDVKKWLLVNHPDKNQDADPVKTAMIINCAAECCNKNDSSKNCIIDLDTGAFFQSANGFDDFNDDFKDIFEMYEWEDYEREYDPRDDIFTRSAPKKRRSKSTASKKSTKKSKSTTKKTSGSKKIKRTKRCKCYTLSGDRCKRNRSQGSMFCSLHKNCQAF